MNLSIFTHIQIKNQDISNVITIYITKYLSKLKIYSLISYFKILIDYTYSTCLTVLFACAVKKCD